MKQLFFLSITLALLISCSPSQKVAGQKSPAEGIWQLSYLYTATTLEELYSGRKPVINFRGDQVSGNNGCNSFSGKLAMSGNKINFKDAKIATTMMACAGSGEQTFMETLNKVDRYSISNAGKTLTFLHGNSEIMRFEKQ